MTDWDKRIPAAIAKAEGWFKQPGIIGVAVFVSAKGDAVYVTAGEVAVVKALWRVTMAEGWHIDPALREFVAKMERLGND